MAVQTAKAFRTALRKEPLQNFYYLYGADLVQVAELTDQLVQVATNQQPESLVVAGGVAANQGLRERLASDKIRRQKTRFTGTRRRRTDVLAVRSV